MAQATLTWTVKYGSHKLFKFNYYSILRHRTS